MLSRFSLGVKLMSFGAKLCLNSETDKQALKDAININTVIGAYADSGGHLLSSLTPITEYDTQSVINVLKQELLIKKDLAFNSYSPTTKEAYYKENWK